MRKGQITVFIVMGMILAVLIILAFAFKGSIVEQASKFELTKGLTMTGEARKVQSDMKDCIKEVAEFGLVVMGLQGGYTALDSRVHHTETTANMNYVPYFGTAYLYFKGQNMVPTKEMMEKQLASFVAANSLICEDQYEGWDVDYGDMEASAVIRDEKINLDLDLNVKVKKEDKESGFSDLKLELPVRLGIVHSSLNKMMDQQIKISEDELCISCVSRIAAENDMIVSIDRIGEDIFYTITDEKSKVIGHDFIFLLANKF